MLTWAFTAQAQFNNMFLQAFTVDTLTNSDNANFEFSKKFDFASDITFVIIDTEVSGSATNTAVFQQAACNTCSDWVTTDTIAAITATGSHVFHATADPQHSGEKLLWGYRARVRCVSTGTGVHTVKIYAIARRRN